jgi:hypothetical protein
MTAKGIVFALTLVLGLGSTAFGQSTQAQGGSAQAGGGPSGPGLASGQPGIQPNELYLDLPIDAPPLTVPGKTAPTPPPPPPPPPPQGSGDPTIYGKTQKSENGTIVYVIDVSGSMGWDMGQYTAPDGSTQTGDRLDRAKAELAKSVVSLPNTFKFNMYSYDCGSYPWQGGLQPADDQHKQDAMGWISNLQPMGATGTGAAVAQALNSNTSCKLFVLLTDGAPNCDAGDESGDASCIAAHLQMIDQNNTQHAVINVFGIGATGEFKQFCMDVASQNGGQYSDVR